MSCMAHEWYFFYWELKVKKEKKKICQKNEAACVGSKNAHNTTPIIFTIVVSECSILWCLRPNEHEEMHFYVLSCFNSKISPNSLDILFDPPPPPIVLKISFELKRAKKLGELLKKKTNLRSDWLYLDLILSNCRHVRTQASDRHKLKEILESGGDATILFKRSVCLCLLLESFIFTDHLRNFHWFR